MTPEERETHAETLRGLAGGIYIDASLPILHLAPAEKAACRAGAAALASPPTCGTCADLLRRLRACGQLSGYWTSEIDDALAQHAPMEPTR